MGVIESLIAFSQTLFGWPVFPAVLPELALGGRNYFAYLFPGVSTTVIQGSGTLLHFNFLGAVLDICVPLAFGLWLVKLHSPLRAACFAITVLGVVATFSRGALIGTAIGVIFILLFQRSRSRRSLVVLGLCAAVLVGLLAANTFAQYYETTQNVNVRVETWRLALNQSLEKPSNLLLGYGFDHFHGAVLASGVGGVTTTVQTTIMAALHSGYLQILLEFGLVGLVLFGLWLYAVIRAGLAAPRSPFRIMLLGACLAFLAHQAIDNAMFNYAGVLFVAMMACIERERADDLAADDL